MQPTKTWLRIRQSFWFLPAVYGVAGLVLAAIAAGVDLSFPKGMLKSDFPGFLVADKNLAMQISGTLVQSILTMMTVTFSTIMVVLTTFTSQFSPRALQNFISDRTTQLVLAVFVGSVTYNLYALLAIKPSTEKMFLTSLIAILTATLCVAAFVYFINHVAKWVQVNNLINKLSNESLKTIKRVNQGVAKLQDKPNREEVEGEEPKGEKHVITAENSGYVGMINFQSLVNMAEQDDVYISFHVHVGDFVVQGVELFSYWTHADSKAINEQRYRIGVKLDTERTDVQDIEFGIQKLVEITLRAISPAVNDPHTAINCINRIGTLLFELGKREQLSSYLYDSQNQWRVRIKQFDFDHYLYKGFFQIRHYAKEDVSVTTSIIYVLKLIAAKSSPAVGKSVRDFSEYIYGGFNKDVLLPLDEEYLNKEFNELAEITGGLTK